MKQKKPVNLNPFVLIFGVVILAWIATFLITPGTLVDGVYTADPRKDPSATLIPTVEELTPEILALAGDAGTALGTGGMVTKLRAAEICLECGCTMVIANGNAPERLYDILEGKQVGTTFGEEML